MGPHYRIVSSQLDEGWLSTPACRLCTNYHMCVKMKVMVHVIGFHSHMIESVEPLNSNGRIGTSHFVLCREVVRSLEKSLQLVH